LAATCGDAAVAAVAVDDWSDLASSKWTPSFMLEGLDFLAIPMNGFLKRK